MGADFEVNHIKIAVKTVVVLIILILVMANRKKDSVKAPIFGTIGVLTLSNVILAVFW